MDKTEISAQLSTKLPQKEGHSKLFEMAWELLENNKMYHETPATVLSIISTLNSKQVKELLLEIQESIKRESVESINFCLLLSFRKIILDCIIHIWTVEDFQLILKDLHPIECVYILLNTYQSEPSLWFENDLEMAYSIFSYIVRWINWKIDENTGDEYYYSTYFNNYDRNEKKKIMSTIGTDMLVLIERNPLAQSLEMVSLSLPVLIPLLENEHLVFFWNFYMKLLDHQNIIQSSAFYSALSHEQIRNILSNNENLIRSSTVTSPVIKKGLEENSLLLEKELLKFFLWKYSNSTQEGDECIDESILLTSNALKNDLSEVTVTPLTRLVSKGDFKIMLSILNSKVFQNDILYPIKTLIIDWSLTDHYKEIGVSLTKELFKRADLKVEVEKWISSIKENSIHPKLIRFFSDCCK